MSVFGGVGGGGDISGFLGGSAGFAAGGGVGFDGGVAEGVVDSSLQPEMTASESNMAERVDQVFIPSLILTDGLLVKVVSIPSRRSW